MVNTKEHIREIPNGELLPCVAEMVAEGRKVILKAKGNSMLPSIRWGRDSVELIRPDGLKPGMIVLACLKPGHYVLHRIESMDGDGVALRGDGNLYSREHCRVEDVVAVATHIVRPSQRRVDCSSPCYLRRIRMWLALPAFVRRITLGLYRRLLGTNRIR